MKCIHCEHENIDTAKFCVKCGEPSMQPKREPKDAGICSCGAPLRLGARFCTVCGTPQAPVPRDATAQPAPVPSPRVDLATSAPTVSPWLQDSTVAWRLEPGVLVENVSAGRAANLCLARRLIVEPGTRMLVFRNGALAATLDSGHFELPTVQLDQIPGYQGRVRSTQSGGERWTGGIRQVASAVIGAAAEGARSFWNWCRESVIGVREQDLPPDRRRQRATEQPGRGSGDTQRRPLLGDAIRWEPGFDVISAAAVIHVVLARAGAFNLQFVFEGLAGVNGVAAERVGVEIEVELTDLRALFDRFVADRGVLTMEQLALDLTPFIRTRVAERIRGLRPSEIENSSELLRTLGADLSVELQQAVPGITVRRVLHVTFSHKELERLERLRQELTLAREGLGVAREQADLQNLVDNESLRAELQSLRTVEERRKALREFHEITMRANNVILDRQGNAVSRDELGNHEEGRKIDVERRWIDAEIDRQVALMDMATRLEEAQARDKEDRLMGEISERGLLRQESVEILREQLGQRRRLRGGQNSQDAWIAEAGFNQDRSRIGLIHKQFLALLSIDHRNEQDEKQRDWDYRFRSQDAARKFELDRDGLRRGGELKGLEQTQALSDAAHAGSLEAQKRANKRQQLAEEVGFAQLYADEEMVRLRSSIERSRIANEKAVEDAKTQGTLSNVARGTRVADEEANLRISGMRDDQRHAQDTLKAELEHLKATRDQEIRLKERQAQLDALKVAADIRIRTTDAEQSHATRIRELDNERAIKLAEEETRKYSGKSFEQIMALNPNLNPEVAKAWAVVGSGKADAEAQKRIAEHAHELARIERENAERVAQSSGQMMDRMERMFNTMAGVKETQTSHGKAQQMEQSNQQAHYKDQLLQAEKEKTQMALDQTKQFVGSVTDVTKTSFGAAAHAASGVPTTMQAIGRRCVKCSKAYPNMAAFCEDCGIQLG